MKYLEYEDHKNWISGHYTESVYGSFYLVFCKEFYEKELPHPKNTEIEFDVHLLDTEDKNGTIYKSKWWISYESYESLDILGKDYYPIVDDKTKSYFMLMNYIYDSKLCACNRKCLAAKEGAMLDNDECEGNRFQIHSVVYNGLILMSEVLTEEKLEQLLQ